MVSYIAIDTETTGLPSKQDYKNFAAFDSCRIVSIAVIFYDETDNETSFYESFIKPNGYMVTATEIHGITHEKAVTCGQDFSKVWADINAIIPDGATIIGHNLIFDLNVIKSEALRAGYDEGCFKNINEVCTLKMARAMYPKPHRLGDLYQRLSGTELVGWHGATADARATAYIYKVMKTFKEIPVKKIIIKASEVAACIGMNPFKKPEEVRDEIWKKHIPSTFTGITKNDRAREYLAKSGEAQEVLQIAVSAKAEQSSDTQTIVNEVAVSINADTILTPVQKQEVTDYIRSQVYTTFGTKSEDKTSDKVVLEEGVKLIRDESFYSFDITTICGTKYVIVGKIDRIEVKPDGTKTLVEIKNRTRCLFNLVKDYEMIQIQTYLQMTGMSQARLIEQHNHKTASQELTKDDEYWNNTIKPKLELFCRATHMQIS